MPKYSFVCRNCHEEFTIKALYEEKWDSICPKCGGKEKKEVYKPMGFEYIHDLRRKMGLDAPAPGHCPR